ncbi:protein far1-related sequence 5 [Phtheirospermum japonicum]|uniref:Protein FAR1-RELATED SEQUENCE n=1 Tax=Phtheirospermum japonicum TaxID=374723 RepID=A0A830DK86_9LAMI|nr:protein far1-related sequence 5 [Phtheirospermum japonicum]
MIDDYNLASHKWLNGMYKLRHKWATAFSNERFSAGLLATSRSEATNLVLKKAGNRSISLYDFVMNYEKIQKSWRDKEKVEDTRCRHGKPSPIVKNHPLLSHAAAVYTLNIYKLFELELINSLNTIFDEQPLDFGSPLLEYKVRSHDQNSKVRQVVYNRQSHEVKCSCHRFESLGILCKHVLKVFNYMNVTTLPKSYIKKRWMKNVRNRVFDETSGHESRNESGHTSEMVFVNQTMRLTYNLTMQAKAYAETRNALVEILNSANQQINALIENLSFDDQNNCENLVVDEDGENEVLARNPLYVKSRGITNACIVRHWDDKSKKGKCKGKRKRKRKM